MQPIMKIQSGLETIEKKVLYAKAVFGKKEKDAVLQSLENGWLASGPLVKKFEEKVSKLFGKKYGIAVNSGSSANLLALHALSLEPGSEVITPACTFATTASEIVNTKLVPVFVDSVIGRYTINEDLVEPAINKKTKAIMVPQLIGGICDMRKLKTIAKKHKLYLIDDSCDTFAPRLHQKTVASYADVSTSSFYGSHIITACGFGGIVMTDSKKLAEKLVTLRDWGRVGNDLESFENRFNCSLDNIPYDAKFLYSEFGYNLKMNESAAAFGLVQLERLPGFIKRRTRNFALLKKFFSNYEKWFHLPYLIKGAETNWLAFPLCLKKEAPFSRYDTLKHLESCGIQTRVLFSGNILRHPVYKKNHSAWKAVGSLKIADHIMGNGFLLGCHQGMLVSDVKYVISSAKSYLAQY